mgnify:CR=1 FL=1
MKLIKTAFLGVLALIAGGSVMAERGEERRLQVGSGERSEKIRTYNYPQNRVTDHRIGLTLYKLGEVIAGDLDAVEVRSDFRATALWAPSVRTGEDGDDVLDDV